MQKLHCVCQYLSTGKEAERSRHPTLLRRAQDFFIEAALEIRKHFQIRDPVIEMLQVLDPNASHAKFPSLVPLASRFPNLIPISKLQQLDNEWRKLSFTTLPFDSEGMEPEVFWGRLGKISNGVGTLQFHTLSAFMGSKTRNRLHTKTVGALLKVKRGVAKAGGCMNFSPPPGAKA